MSDLILTERSDGLLRVTLNRVEKANALSAAMLNQLIDVFRSAATDMELRALVLTGAGEKVFCAGADLSELNTGGDGDDSIWDEMAVTLNRLEILTIAAINGPCIGGGMTLALGCDIRVCLPEARFAYPALRNTILPGVADGGRLRALVGPARAAMLLMGGTQAVAEDALAWGLVDQVAAPDTLDDVVQGLCETALASDRRHLGAIKQVCRGDIA